MQNCLPVSPKASKKQIRFRIDASFERRNVDKHIIRSIILYHTKLRKQILEEYKKFGLTETNYALASESLKKVRELEKKAHQAPKNDKKASKTKRDYGKTINTMLNVLGMQLIMKVCLGFALEKFIKGRVRIKKQNRRTYILTLEDYLEYIDHLLKAQ